MQTCTGANLPGAAARQEAVSSGGPSGRGAIDSNAPASDRLVRIERKLTWLTVGTFGIAVALLFNVAAVFGTIVEFHAGEGLLVGSASAGGVAMGFVFGWLARRAIV